MNKAPWLYPSDIQIDPSSLESSPKTSQAAGPAFPLLSQPSADGQHHAGAGGLLRLPTVGQSPSPAHHDEFRSEVESELDFEEQGLLPGEEGGGAGEQLATRLELPPGVTGVESCRSAMSSPMESYIGDSCGSFEFLPKESPLRRVLRATTTEDKDTPPRDIKREIERRAMEIEEQREADNKAAKAEAEADESNRSNGSREGRRSSGSDRHSSGGQSGSEGRRRRNRKVSATEDPLPGTKEEGDLPRQVNNQVLVEMARDIRPPPLEPSEVRSPRGAKGRAGLGQKESTAAFGPMPNFEREVQRIIAEQEIGSKVVSDMDQSEPPAGQQQQHGGSPAKRKEELVEKLARLDSRYVAPAGAEKPEAAGKVGLAAIRDLAAAQEAALLGKPQPAQGEDEVTPTNDLHLLRLDPSSNRMTLELGQDGRRPPGRFPLELPASPLSPLRSPLSRVESNRSRGSGKGKESEYENGESDCPDDEEVGSKTGLLNLSRDSEQRETDEFEEAERRMLVEEAKAGPLYADEHGGVLLGGEHGYDHAASSLPFALPGRWTGGRREEEEMRRLMRAQHDGETSQSDWSEDEEGRELLGDTDGDGVSMAANGGLTDAEGALSDVNSIYECGGGEAGDLDDTSLSSRASSRIFDSDQIYSADSLHGMYDSEYDNYRGAGGHITSDAESDFAHEDDSEVGGVLDELSLEIIRQISKNITTKFGATRSEKDECDSDAVV